MQPLLQELETCVFEAWPAAETAELEGWVLRASGGPTHRGNSVATLAARGPSSLAVRIERAERWYRERGQRPMFQLGPCAAPAGLDAALEARGYVAEGGAWCAQGPAREVLERSAPRPGEAELEGRVDESPGQSWLRLNASASRYAGQLEGFLGFVSRLGSRCCFVSVYGAERSPAAVALGVASGQRLGVYAMLTAPARRRQGAGRAALRTLARRALEQGQDELYLLVESGNAAARGLYAGCGFRDVYAYHYRVDPSDPRP
jgi:ribosomal protein S18 acetylase RimI-like enzyme